MDHQERDRGRTSRASSTSSLGREVRCACQFFQSDSLLPERRAMLGSRPSSRNANQPIVTDCHGDEDPTASDTHREHEYEPIGTPLVNPRTMTPVTPSAPVVRIIDTDVAPVADSDDSIDLGARFGPVLEGNELVLPLDGRIEDSAMETRELAGGGDTSEELESPQQLQDRLEERFFNAATPCTESRTDGEVNTSQVDSSAMEELPLRRGARGLPQRLRSQAGKLRSRIKSMQRPNFSLSIDRLRSKKSKSPGVAKSRGPSEATKRSTSERRSPPSDRGRNSSSLEAAKPPKATDKRSRMERIRSSLAFDRPRLSLPDRSKFHLPERPRFNIKRPNVRLPTLRKSKRGSSLEARRSQECGRSDGSTSAEATTKRKNIFDFSTYPRIFDRKSRGKNDYATSSPKESRAESLESSTLPRSTKVTAPPPLGPRWSLKFTDIKFADDEDDSESKTLAERSKPWRRPSLEQPRVSLRPQESLEDPESLPWQEPRRPEDIPYPEDEDQQEDENVNPSVDRVPKLPRLKSEESYDDDDPPQIDPRLYGDQAIRLEDDDSMSRSIEEARLEREAYRAAFEALDPRYHNNKRAKLRDTENSADLGTPLEDEEVVSSGMDEDTRSDREQQQSSGSSYDRRRRGIVEIPGMNDSEEFLAAEEARVALYLSREMRTAPENALAHEILTVTPKPPPQRPERKRSLRKRREASIESGEIVVPVRPKRDNRRRSLDDYDDYEDDRAFPDNADDESLSESRHRVVYHAALQALGGIDEPLDDIVVVKPQRRKSRTSLTSQSLRRSESLVPPIEESVKVTEVAPSAPPRRRKRPRGEEPGRVERVNGIGACNGHHSPAMIIGEPEIARAAAPRKPQRATSRETLGSVASVRYDRVEKPPPVPPKRSSRSRGASLVPDDDRTSHGAESIPEVGYFQEEMPRDEDVDSRLDYPGYAIIEKRDKPPRPPPPRKRRDEKFATCPRPGKGPPSRAHRAYSTLRPARPETPGEVAEDEATAYEELMDSDEDNERRLRSGHVVSKIQGRPLPAPPRPPRSRREKNADEPPDEDCPKESSPGGTTTSEAFASTQTDPLPDDMVIEEEVTRAKLVVTPSRSGSQVLVSTERVPSPTMANFTLTRSYSHGAASYDRVPDPAGSSGYTKSEEFTCVPPERTCSQRSLERARLSPVRRSTAPTVPPLPASKCLYRDDSPDYYEPRPASPQIARQRDVAEEDDEEAETRMAASMMSARLRERLSERLRLEDELEQARNLRAAILANEPLKIGSLEVSDLRVDRLNVNSLEAQKLTASEIEALVVSASEITSKAETRVAEVPPNLLRELIAIRSQLELVNASQETPGAQGTVVRDTERKRDRSLYTGVQEHLQLDQVSRTTETRAIFSSVGTSRESSPTSGPLDEASRRRETSAKHETSEVLSRSSSPSRTGSPTGPRQTASPVKSLPPVISVTPDTPEPVRSCVESSDSRIPQRATLSYVQEEETLRSSPTPPLPVQTTVLAGDTRFVTFPTSQIPPEFFRLASAPTTTSISPGEPGVLELGQQLARALRIACRRAMRHFVGYIVNRIGHDDTDTKTREVELALCALLLIIAGLLIVCFGGPRTVTHHHHWDYFNPPRL